MKIRYHYTLLTYFLLISNLVISQSKKDTTSNSPLLFPQFIDGIITLKDGTVCSGKLNYDTSIDEMQFIGTKNEILSFAEPEKVAKVVIANRTFIHVKNFFVEILTEGPVSLCLKVHQKRIAEKIGAYGGTSSTSSIESLTTVKLSDGTMTKLSPNEKVTFQMESLFYLMYNGKIKLILNQNDLFKYFSSHKELIRQELENQHTKVSSIDSMKKIIEWMNAKGIKD